MDGFILEKSKTEEALHELTRRASFDLSCPWQELRFTILAVHDDAGPDMPKQVGVNGCNKSATYVKEYVGFLETGWSLDATGVRSVATPNAPATPAPNAAEAVPPATAPPGS